VDKVSNAVVVLLADFRYVFLDDVLEHLVAPVSFVLLLFHLIDLGASEEWQLLCPWHQSNLFSQIYLISTSQILFTGH
jgi:hypothetical protein